MPKVCLRCAKERKLKACGFTGSWGPVKCDFCHERQASLMVIGEKMEIDSQLDRDFDNMQKARELGYEYWPAMMFGKPAGWYKAGTHDDTDDCFPSAAAVVAAVSRS